VVGFVCEGSTDIVVLRRLVEATMGTVDARPLRPVTDELDRQRPGTQAGWSEVRAWCQDLRSFDELFKPEVGDPLDLLVIAIDLDIAIRAGVAKLPANLDAYDASELCTLVKSWLPKPIPGKVIIAIPVMAAEAWILAALFPKLAGVERLPDPAGVLVERDKIEQGRNGPWKRASEYRAFADTVASKLKRVRQECAEANRFVAKLENVGASPR
jgi:hypothetical protein